MRPFVSLSILAAAGMAIVVAAPTTHAQREVRLLEPREARAELARAMAEGEAAQVRAARFAAEAEAASEAAQKAEREAAALAARIQESEAASSAARARYSLARAAREELRASLSERQQPLVRLTGALQTTSRRPLALSALQPGSLEDLVHIRAVLASAVPQIRERTAALRSELERGERLERRAAQALTGLRRSEERLQERRSELAALETRQRLASRSARGSAAREETRALALAEEARDLDGLIVQLDQSARLRRELAALPGPIPRPSDVGRAVADPVGQAPPASSAGRPSSPPDDFRLPAQGRIIAGYGERQDSGLRATGLSIAPAAAAQIVAPASGRVAFAGPYRGFGNIIIIEHDRGWTSLVTGLARTGLAVGDLVIGGAPIGNAGQRGRVVTLELRRDGEPVNPLAYVR
ncbi:MAG: peptidoglycan DD-metalloendopeptidase family protein [Erythrobacter sp.]